MIPELRKHYGHKWRSVTRPRILARDGYCCTRCHKPWKPLDVAHLVVGPGAEGHDEDMNLAALCRKCHRQHDYNEWARKFRSWLRRQHEDRLDRLDADRPILTSLREGC